MVNKRPPSEAFLDHRALESATKRVMIERAVAEMIHNNEKVTHTEVARRAGVSRWLTYQPGIREMIEGARDNRAEDVEACFQSLMGDPDHISTIIDWSRRRTAGDGHLLLWTVEETAKQMGVSERRVRQLVADGKLWQLTIAPFAFISAASAKDLAIELEKKPPRRRRG